MLFAKPNETYTHYRIPGLVLTSAGTLLGCCECRRGGSDWAAIDLMIKRSTDYGESWDTSLVIPGNGETLNNPVLTVCKDKILFMYCKNYKQLFICESEDDGKSFTSPKELKGVFEEYGSFCNAAAIGPGHGIIKDGTVIIPVWFAYNREDPKAHRPSFISTIYSKDNGASWHSGEIIDKEVLVNPSECASAVWQDKVIISIRNENPEFRRAFSCSENGYEGWSAPKLYPNMPDPICQGSMTYTEKAVYHINCASDKDYLRIKLTLKISDDCFKTYKSILVDEQGGYADIAVHKDTVYILYEKNYGMDGLFFKTVKPSLVQA
jgi:sialidase-1